MSEPETIAAVDLGTNSFHLVVARVVDGDRFEVIAREKEMVRLGSGATDMSELSPEAIERGVAALARCRAVAEVHGAALVAVATSAVREAANAGEFLARARDEAGVEVEVITGAEEARLIHLGVLQAVPVFDKRLVLIDIGGGSTEVLVGERRQVLAVGSLKLGAIRLTERFFRSEVLHPGAVDACARHVRNVLAPMTRLVRREGFEVAVGSSGTIEAIAALAIARAGEDVPRTLNNTTLTHDQVRAVVADLVEAGSAAAWAGMPGMDSRRADIILAGAVILDQAMTELGIDALIISDYALREGVLLDAIRRRHGAALHHLRDLRRSSVVHLADLMDPEREHGDQVARLALALFDQTAALSLHDLGDAERELLEAAALLANVGLFVSFGSHHKHSYYVVRNSDRLMGFTDHEIELIAATVRYHRKSLPKPTHPEFEALRPVDQQRVRVMAGLLRVAIGLDRSHAGLVTDVACHLDTEDAALHIVAEHDADTDLALELHTANERRELLAVALDRPVVVEAAD